MLVYQSRSGMKWPVSITHAGGRTMVASVTAVLSRFNTEWATPLPPEALVGACAEAGYPSWRDRVLPPVTTIQLFLLQMLHGHTACTPLPPLSGIRVRAAAYCQARTPLPLDRFGFLLTRVCAAAPPHASDAGRGPGHRPFFVEGSGGSMPAAPALQGTFGPPNGQRSGGGLPGARLRGRCHAGTGLLLKLAVAPLLTHALAQVQQVHPRRAPGDVRVADRGLCSDAHLALRVQAGSALGPAGGPAHAGRHRHPTLALASRARRPCPTRDLVDAEHLSLMACQGAVGSPPRGLSAPGGALPDRHARLPGSPGAPRDDAARCGGLSCRRPGRVVPPTLAKRNRTGTPQDDQADGRAAPSNRAGRAEGPDRLCQRLQPRPPGPVALCPAPTHQRGAEQLPGCAPVARRATYWPITKGVAGSPETPSSGGAAGQETAAQELPLDDHTPARIASAVGPASARRLTSCHAPKSHDVSKSVDTICGYSSLMSLTTTPIT